MSDEEEEKFRSQCLGCGGPVLDGKHLLSGTYGCPRYPEGVV